MENKIKIAAMDCTPKWVRVLPILIETAYIPTSRQELRRMAEAADKYSELVKEVDKTNKDTIESFKKLIAIIKDPEKLKRGANLQIIKDVQQLIEEYEKSISNKGLPEGHDKNQSSENYRTRTSSNI